MKSKEAMQILQVSRDEFYYLVNVKKLIKKVKKIGKYYEYLDEDINKLCGKINHRQKPRKALSGRFCIICGQPFIPSFKHLNNSAYKGICCSRQCGATYRKQRGDFEGANNPAWRNTKLKRICLECGKEFMAKPCDIERGYGKYCSKSCRIIHTYKTGKFNTKPNKPEKILIKLFENYNLPFKYVGNGDIWIGNHNPDFININSQKQVIEFFGSYWHPASDIVQWINHYNKYGFNCLIILENEMLNIDGILAKVRNYEGNKTI